MRAFFLALILIFKIEKKKLIGRQLSFKRKLKVTTTARVISRRESVFYVSE